MARLLFGFLTPEGSGPQYWNVLFHSYLRKELGRVMLARQILLTPAHVQELYGAAFRVLYQERRVTHQEIDAYIAAMTCAKIQPFFAYGDYGASLALVRKIRQDLVAPSPFPTLVHISEPEEALRECTLLGLGEAHFRYAAIIAEEARIADEGPPLFQDRGRAEQASPLAVLELAPST